MHRFRDHRELAIALLTALLGVGSVVALGVAGWPGTPFDCGSQPCYCELPTPGLTRQTGNTWSNLGPVFAGVLVAVWAGRRRRKRASTAPALDVLGMLFPPVLVFQGVGSMYFHGGLTMWGSAVDAMSMFATTGLLVATNAHRLGYVTAKGLPKVWVTMMVLGLVAGFAVPPVVPKLIFVLVFSILVTEVWISRRGLQASSSMLRLGLAIHIAGVVVWFFSASEVLPLCLPDSPLQGHGLWHLTAATAVALFAVHAFGNLERKAPAL